MNTIIIIIGIIFIILLAWLIFEVKKSQVKKPVEDSNAMQMLLQQMNTLRESMEDKIAGSNRDKLQKVIHSTVYSFYLQCTVHRVLYK